MFFLNFREGVFQMTWFFVATWFKVHLLPRGIAVIFEQPVMSLEVVAPRIQVFSFMRVRERPTTGPKEMKGFTEIH